MRGTVTILRWSAAAAALAALTAAAGATPGEMHPINICLIQGSDQICVSHVDEDDIGWFLVNVSSVHPDLPDLPFPDGQKFRVTGQFCTDCIQTFCGTFAGFIFNASIVPCKDGDVSGDGEVDVQDLVDVVQHWGDCPTDTPATCVGDADGDDTVGIGDLVMVIENWGS